MGVFMTSEPHNGRAVFCPCDRCEAKRAIARRDAADHIINEGADPMIFNFTARQLGIYLELAVKYRKGQLN